ncbi:hypothetical protein BaRGS_00002432 [Batillaria attramentaria]|uniref:Uncharacterized protein n=1 Tax=Batillaria attramentaria TaxID=370345 RepID=A0ABD0M3T5_9CAEN
MDDTRLVWFAPRKMSTASPYATSTASFCRVPFTTNIDVIRDDRLHVFAFDRSERQDHPRVAVLSSVCRRPKLLPHSSQTPFDVSW